MNLVRTHCPECLAYPQVEAADVTVILWPDRQTYAFRCPCGARVSRPCSPAIVDLLTIHAGCRPVRLALPERPERTVPPLTGDDLIDFALALNDPEFIRELVPPCRLGPESRTYPLTLEKPLIRNVLTAIAVALGILALALLAPLPSGGGVPVSHGPIRVPSQSPMSLDGVGVAVRATGAFYAAAATTTTTRPAVRRAPVAQSAPRPVNTHGCQYEAQILAAGLPARMVGIAWRESNCTARAASPTECLGLFQLCWPLHADIEQAACGRSDREGMFDPACNIAMTVRLWNGGAGARHWSL